MTIQERDIDSIWADPNSVEGLRAIVNTIVPRYTSLLETYLMARRERDALATRLAARPAADALWDAMKAKADTEGAIHRDDMIAVLRDVGGLR